MNVASLVDRENLVVEIFYDNVYWAEISQETSELVVQFYDHPKQNHWDFSYNEALEALEEAKREILGLNGRYIFNNLVLKNNETPWDQL